MEDLALAGGELGCLADAAGVALEGDEVEPFELTAEVAPGVVGLAFGDPDEQEREPADEDVGADALLEAVEDRAEPEGALEVAEGAFGLEQVLVAERGVFGADVRVAGGDEELAVEALLGGDLGAVDPGPAARGVAEVAGERRVGAQLALGLGVPPAGRVGLGLLALGLEPRDLGADPVDLCLPLGPVALRFGRVVADDEPLPLGVSGSVTSLTLRLSRTVW